MWLKYGMSLGNNASPAGPTPVAMAEDLRKVVHRWPIRTLGKLAVLLEPWQQEEHVSLEFTRKEWPD